MIASKRASPYLISEGGHQMNDEPFAPGDRVELVRHYSFFGAPPPQGTVVGTTNRLIRCKMDRSGRVIRFQ